MDVGEVLESLGIGLSRALRYMIPGALLVFAFALVDPCRAKSVYDLLGWELSIFCAVLIGIAFYATHRSLVIPIHHLLGCALLWTGDMMCTLPRRIALIRTRFHLEQLPADARTLSLSPTRWLRSLGVPRFRLMLAYGDLRRYWFNKKEDPNVLDKEERSAIEVIHAENGLLVIVSEVLFAAWVYSSFVFTANTMDWRLLLAVALFFVSAISGMQQHRVECAHFKTDINRAAEIVRKFSNP